MKQLENILSEFSHNMSSSGHNKNPKTRK